MTRHAPCPICDGRARHMCINCDGCGTVEETPAVFRVFSDGTLIALFPTIPANADGHCMCYQRIGQHGAADHRHVIATSRPATPDDYASLLVELMGIGYAIRPVRRVTRRMDEERRAKLRGWLANGRPACG